MASNPGYPGPGYPGVSSNPPTPTVREMVTRIQGELRQGALEPDRARENLITLSALYGNCLQEIREADAAYAVVLLAHLDSSEKANRAKIRADTSPEHLRKQEARDIKELVLEMIRALKYLMRSLEEEMRLAK